MFCPQARKLGGLLKDADRRREELKVELSGQVLEVERSRADMEELLQHNSRLQRDSEEHQALKGAYNTLLNRSEALWWNHGGIYLFVCLFELFFFLITAVVKQWRFFSSHFALWANTVQSALFPFNASKKRKNTFLCFDEVTDAGVKHVLTS